MTPRTLDATYRTRAIPTGSVRHWSWLFAAPESQPPLLGIYALLAEWTALIDPATDSGAAHIKLSWWQEEVRRLAAGVPVHPISLYLQSLPRASAVDFAPLVAAVDAAAAELNRVPLERTTDLQPQAHALRGNPLAIASQLAFPNIDAMSLRPCIGALALADYLSRAVQEYRREARQGRIPFAVDELLAAGIENSQLIADQADSALQHYLDGLLVRAAEQYDIAAETLPSAQRTAQRHLLVLAALGLARLPMQARRGSSHALPLGSSLGWRGGIREMYLAWSIARRAIRSTRS